VKCRACGQDHDPLLGCARAARIAVFKAKQEAPAVAAPAAVNTQPDQAKSVNKDRHKPGYMAGYMRKKRAEAKGKP
jgi:hypothetical protein